MPPLKKNRYLKTFDDILDVGFPQDRIVDTVTITVHDFRPWNLDCRFSPRRYGSSAKKRTAFDIAYLWNSDLIVGTGLKVVVEIDSGIQKWAQFIPSTPDQTPQNLALTAGNARALQTLCDLKVSPQRISFIIRRIDNSKTEQASFNLGLLFTDIDNSGHQVPVIYDPKVPNDGS